MVSSSILLRFATVHYPSTKLSKHSNCTVNSSNTINMERFAGLNIRGFIFSWKYFCDALASSIYYLTIAKYSRENFHNTLKTTKTVKV